MVPYDKERVSQANELYRQLMETSPQNEETLRQLRSKAIKELGVCFSSKALFQFLCNTCHPRNFMSPYNAEKDITFFEGLAETYITVKPGMFAIFFPQDGHAPGITPEGVKKVIVKVKA